MNVLSRLLLVMVTCVLMAPCALAESVLMVYRDKPPYSYVVNGVAKGFLLKRHILCSHRVSEDALRRINAAIAAEGVRP